MLYNVPLEQVCFCSQWPVKAECHSSNLILRAALCCAGQIFAFSFAALLVLSVCHQNAAVGGSSTISSCWQTGMLASL